VDEALKLIQFKEKYCMKNCLGNENCSKTFEDILGCYEQMENEKYGDLRGE
jgi:hypothetical protein